jgi:hypothetical protein
MSDNIEDTERIKTLYNFVYGNNSGGLNSTQNILNERTATMTYDEFVDKAKKIHGDKYEGYYNYENKENWRGIRNSHYFELFCNETPPDFPEHPHGEFEVSPRKHIEMARGCDVCTGRRNTKYTWLQKIKDKKLHQDTEGNFIYNYDKVPFNIKDKDYVTIWCPKPNHGDFPQRVSHHSYGSGCPKCSESKGEKSLETHLINQGISYTRPQEFPNCKSKKCRPLRFDFYLKDYKTLVEIDGEFHFSKVISGYNFDDHIDNDRIKNDFVKSEETKDPEVKYLIRIAYLGGDTKKIIENFDNLFAKIQKNPPEGPIIYSDGYPNPNTNTKPKPVLDNPEDFEKIENDKNLNENISRIKQMMGLINEYIDIPYDEKENTGSTENKPIELIGGLKQDPPEIDKPPAWKKENNTIQLFNRDRLNFRNFIQNILPNVNLKFLGGGAIGVAFVPIGNYTLPTDFTQNNFYGVIPPENTPVVFKFTANSTEVEKIKNLIEKPNNPGLVNYYWIKEVDLPSELQYSTTYGPSKDVPKDERRTQWIKQVTGRYWDTPEPQRKDFKLTPQEIKAGERKFDNIILRKQKEKRTKFKKLYIVCLDKINRIPPELKPILNFCFRYYYWIQFEHKKENVKDYRNFKPISVIRSNYLNDRAMQYFYYKIALRKDVENRTMSSNLPTYEEFVQWFPKLLLAIEKVYSVGKAKTFDLHDGNMGLDDNGNIVFFDVYV